MLKLHFPFPTSLEAHSAQARTRNRPAARALGLVALIIFVAGYASADETGNLPTNPDGVSAAESPLRDASQVSAQLALSDKEKTKESEAPKTAATQTDATPSAGEQLPMLSSSVGLSNAFDAWNQRVRDEIAGASKQNDEAKPSPTDSRNAQSFRDLPLFVTHAPYVAYEPVPMPALGLYAIPGAREVFEGYAHFNQF